MFKLMLMVVLQVVIERRVLRPIEGREFLRRGHIEAATLEADPMEPCYLANNRASESLTISESTPVGTVVGEISVSCARLSSVFVSVCVKLATLELSPLVGSQFRLLSAICK